ncbi:dihydropyrimidinase [Actinomadura graeca]|uniref:Dihydropyrimidinase n=1 Tax=Actinomadura graeca TaxID=2750812 RepID=A0ABX8QUX9_9ACTN|nr:dihydropyrimidinase [Actinomadura graeca]QXJ22546.1 dihydropyrimidinase [Actinomadura graeca]
MSLLIKGGRVITGADDYVADIHVADTTVTTIGASLNVTADKVVDATGCYVLPGGVDPHTHLAFDMAGTRTADDYESGTIAAAFGGTTTVVNFAQQRPGEHLRTAVERGVASAQGKAVIDYGQHIILTQLEDSTLHQLDELVGEGVTSIKMFLAYPGELMVDDATLFQVMERAGELGALCCVHAENGPVIDVLVRRALAAGRTNPSWHGRTRPELAEAEATHRAIAVAEMANAPVYFVHLSCAEALAEVTAARDRGRPVFAETCPHYLFLDSSVYDDESFDTAKYVLTPPLRDVRHQDALWRGLRANGLQVVSTDHCPFCLNGQKDLGAGDFSKIPNGGPGIEHRLQLLYAGVVAGRLPLQRMVEVFATTPARLFGLYPRKGTVAVGSDADLVVFDPSATTTINAATQHMAVDYSMYEGWRLAGAVRTVICGGAPVVENGVFVGTPGRGRFLRREAGSRP